MMYDLLSDDDFETLTKAIEAEGGIPEIVLPLLSILAEASTAGAQAKLAGDNLMTAIHYGRVAGLLDAFDALGQPAPAATASDCLAAAEDVLTDPAAFQALLNERMAGMGEDEADAPGDEG